MLLALGANRDVKDLDGDTPLDRLEGARKNQLAFMATFNLAPHLERDRVKDAVENEIREMLKPKSLKREREL